jgi:hypothetical protein
MDVEHLFARLAYITGEFPVNILTEAVEQRESITPLLLEELRRAAADPEALREKGDNYFRHIYAMYLLARFREQAAYPLLVDIVATPGDIVIEIMADVIPEDLGRMLASVCHGNLDPIKRLIENPEVNEWVRSAALDSLLNLYVEEQLGRDDIIGYLQELLSCKIERKPGLVWSAMVTAACDLHSGELMDEIRNAYEDDLIGPMDVSFPDIENRLNSEKKYTQADIWLLRNGFIGELVDEIGWWSCFDVDIEDDDPDPKQQMNPDFHKYLEES